MRGGTAMGTGGGSGPVWTRGGKHSSEGQDKKKVRGTHSLETVDVGTGQDTESKPSKGTGEVRGRSGQDRHGT